MALKDAVAAIIHQGGDPARYRMGLAERFGAPIAVVDAAISEAGPLRRVDAETVAQERLAEERRLQGTPAHRAWSHEEE